MSAKLIAVTADSYRGANQHGRNLATFISRKCQGFRGKYFDTTLIETLRAVFALHRASALIVFGGPAPTMLVRIVARALRLPVMVFWAGSDVTTAIRNPKRTSRLLLTRSRHFAVAQWLADELASVDINARIVRVANVTVTLPAPRLPPEFTILTYLPAPRRTFYGLERIVQIARHFPNTKIFVVGRGKPDAGAPSNMHYLGHVRVDEVYETATVLVRLCDHDGMANMVVEALANGRHCIWNYEIPGVRCVKDADAAIRVIADLKARHEAGTLELNHTGRHYVAKNFTPALVADKLIALIESALQDERAAN